MKLYKMIEDVFKPADDEELNIRDKNAVYHNYLFKLEVRGYGTNPDDAWIDCVDSLSAEPGEPPEFELEDD